MIINVSSTYSASNSAASQHEDARQALGGSDFSTALCSESEKLENPGKTPVSSPYVRFGVRPDFESAATDSPLPGEDEEKHSTDEPAATGPVVVLAGLIGLPDSLVMQHLEVGSKDRQEIQQTSPQPADNRKQEIPFQEIPFVDHERVMFLPAEAHAIVGDKALLGYPSLVGLAEGNDSRATAGNPLDGPNDAKDLSGAERPAPDEAGLQLTKELPFVDLPSHTGENSDKNSDSKAGNPFDGPNDARYLSGAERPAHDQMGLKGAKPLPFQSTAEVHIASAEQKAEPTARPQAETRLVTGPMPSATASVSAKQGQTVAESNTSSHAEKTDVIAQIVDKIELMVRGKNSEITVSLKPEFLGRITLRASMVNDALVTTIIAESATVRKIIESELPALQHSLQDSGLHGAKIVIAQETETNFFGSAAGPSYSHQQQGSGFQWPDRTPHAPSLEQDEVSAKPRRTPPVLDSRYRSNSIHLIA